jgi:hypothetical protein
MCDCCRGLHKLDRRAVMTGLAEIAAKAAFAPISITGGVLVDDAMKLFAT